ncbi:hypothetical protein HGT70_06680 [Rosenbergiella collisarenosi]|uniref:hypothetical protein n=1 Tax=Rosenbergiella collisarenosi TaxID=1544695 RepID=UPI001BDAC391|nr:hypothetical protein [Rosenbergiella collisarenosi]MBT0720966.1 hypothetical protein [Rosenbergiella collisarenosi]
MKQEKVATGQWAFDEHLLSRFQQVVHRAGMNNAQFANHLGLSRGFISDVSRGTQRPGLTFLPNSLGCH